MPTYDRLDIEQLLGRLSMELRHDAVRSLLAGNDTTGCFTVEAYQHQYGLEWERGAGGPIKTGPISRECAEMQLRSVGCREVKPGIWTKE